MPNGARPRPHMRSVDLLQFPNLSAAEQRHDSSTLIRPTNDRALIQRHIGDMGTP